MFQEMVAPPPAQPRPPQQDVVLRPRHARCHSTELLWGSKTRSTTSPCLRSPAGLTAMLQSGWESHLYLLLQSKVAVGLKHLAVAGPGLLTQAGWAEAT